MGGCAFPRACFRCSRNMHDNAVGVLTEGAKTDERIVVLLKVLKRRIRELPARKIFGAIHAGRNVVVEENQTAWVAHGRNWSITALISVKIGRIRTATEGERKPGNRYQNRISAELADAVAKVVP